MPSNPPPAASPGGYFPAIRHALVATFLLAIAAAPWALQPLGVARAAHPHSLASGKHLFYLHYSSSGHGSFDEDYCADSYNNTPITDSQLLTIVRNTLVIDTPQWDLTANSKVDLWAASDPCFDYADRNWIEIEFRLDHPSKPGWCGGYSCVALVGPLPSASDIDHYQWANVYLVTGHIDGGSGEYHQTINHEFGHVVGLADPSYGDCGPPTSIMHTFTAYGCGYVEFRQSADVSSVTTIADNTSHGYYD